MKKRIRVALTVFTSVVFLCAIAFLAYTGTYYHASEQALAFGSATLTAGSTDYQVFLPESGQAEYAIIFYPGGKVETEAYAPLCRNLADNGIVCALVEMPLRLAVFAPDAAAPVIPMLQLEYGCEHIYLCGHSLGGAMACQFASSYSGVAEGVILLAAYSAADLQSSNLRILSIYGTEDGVMKRDKYAASMSRMPADFTEIILDGGCHGFFGDYGMQAGDGVPTITRERQLALTVEAIVQWLK